ncbi:unnamed protein product [Linum tenue]|uniref:2-oxoglutarate-dependent dioxygenase DAO n=1 Tax=Linum tenue TaxID=586396 RepID=A0AAV0NH18_9ROSI|nr:unnamed protein product [Linum tenue]
MGSIREAPTDLKLPFIDFSKPHLKPGTPHWDSLKSQVREALENYGCFEASFERVPSKLRSDVFDSLEELFDLPLPTKQRSVVPNAFHQGYLGQHPLYPFFESFGLEDPTLLEVIRNFSNTLWPQGGNPSFSKNIHSLSEMVSELDQTVRTMTLESFGLEKYMDEHMSFASYHLRVMKYEAIDSQATLDPQLVLRVHTDKGLITILCQNEVEGLEFETKKGEWVKYTPTSPSSFVVLAGDSLHAWLNGRVHYPYHRVRLCGNDKPRYSFGLFTTPKDESTVKAPEELIDEQHPLLFKPFVYKQYLDVAFTQAGRKEAAPLRAFYGL